MVARESPSLVRTRLVLRYLQPAHSSRSHSFIASFDYGYHGTITAKLFRHQEHHHTMPELRCSACRESQVATPGGGRSGFPVRLQTDCLLDLRHRSGKAQVLSTGFPHQPAPNDVHSFRGANHLFGARLHGECRYRRLVSSSLDLTSTMIKVTTLSSRWATYRNSGSDEAECGLYDSWSLKASAPNTPHRTSFFDERDVPSPIPRGSTDDRYWLFAAEKLAEVGDKFIQSASIRSTAGSTARRRSATESLSSRSSNKSRPFDTSRSGRNSTRSLSISSGISITYYTQHINSSASTSSLQSSRASISRDLGQILPGVRVSGSNQDLRRTATARRRSQRLVRYFRRLYLHLITSNRAKMDPLYFVQSYQLMAVQTGTILRQVTPVLVPLTFWQRKLELMPCHLESHGEIVVST